jgi:hypothetical protein
MKSGIYLFTFPDGAQYIGRSFDAYKKVKEHAAAMANGKAPKLLQDAYNKHGYPKFRVIFYCHTDHLELMEVYFIAKYKPQLNTHMSVDGADSILKVLEENRHLLEFSTADHINYILKLTKEVADCKLKQTELEKELNSKYHDARTDRELRIARDKIDSLERELEGADQRAAKWEHRAKMSWIKKVLNKW